MSTQGLWKKEFQSLPNKEEKKTLKELGINMKDRKAVIAATKELREKNKPVPPPPKPTQEELLTQILEELKKQNKLAENASVEAPVENTKENIEE